MLICTYMLGTIISGYFKWIRIIGQWSKMKKCGITQKWFKYNLNNLSKSSIKPKSIDAKMSQCYWHGLLYKAPVTFLKAF